MSLKRNIAHPNFIIGLISYLMLLVGVVLNASSFELGKTLIIASVVLGGVHWIGSLVNVWTDPYLKSHEAKRYFWFALVIMIPPLSGMMYYMINEKRLSF